MKYRGIIFDMDGTIVDTEHIWAEATQTLITKRGIILTPEIEAELSLRLAGRANAACCQIIKDMFGFPDEVADLVREKGLHANALYAKGLKFIDGFMEFHRIATQEHGLQVGLATNAEDHTLHITKQLLDLEKYFGKHLYNISHVNNLFKPHPAVYLHAAKQLDLDPAHCIAVEDSSAGIQAARDAGMFCIGINSSKKPERLTNSHMIINHYDEINLKDLLKIT